MKQEDKELLLKDLCARLPYGFLIHRYSDNVDIEINTIDDFSHFLEYSNNEKFKPYLRSMSSMTEEEIKEFSVLGVGIHLFKGPLIPSYDTLDWLNAHHFDYRGLIEKGLALEALEGMYKK